MRWSIVRLIWFRELRDQLRDRRTIFMIAVLPIFLYPIAGFGLMQLALGFLKKSSVVEIQGAENLPKPSPCPAVSWFALTPPTIGTPLAGIERAVSAAVLFQNRLGGEAPLDYPPLLVKEGDAFHIAYGSFDSPEEARTLDIKISDRPLPAVDAASPSFVELIDRSALTNRQADLLLVVPPHFREDLEAAKQPRVFLLVRPSDDRSRLVNTRMSATLSRWGMKLTDVRLVRLGLPSNYDEPFTVIDPEKAKPTGKRAADELFDVLVRVFPFILVMWSLAGALYPAVDVCAGEKERGTMETLLISPASREEIVWGKFLTIWVFSAATALLNLFSMGLTTMQFSSAVKIESFNPLSLLWGVLLLPLSAFFSAVCLSIGAYARSSKEGQYYLMPLFLLTMPLIFLTLAPDVTLNPFYSMVPITGVALLLQKLMATGTLTRELMVYFIPVLGPMVIYSWLALRWAIEQFQREEVLFREAERLDIALWLRSMFREKELLPSTGQALFCFGLVIGLSRMSISFGEGLPLMAQIGIRYLAFVATPPLFMAMLVTRRPWQTLGLRLPPWWAWPVAAALAVLLFLPSLPYTYFIVKQIPAMRVSLEEYLRSQSSGLPSGSGDLSAAIRWQVSIVAVLGPLCEELAFRGFILSGMRRRFKSSTAVLVSSFLFALSQMNVFQFIPHFVVGVAMGFLVIRAGSILPAMLCHLVFNAFIYGPIIFPEEFAYFRYANKGVDLGDPGLVMIAVVSLLAAAAMLYAVWRWAPAATDDGEASAIASPTAAQTIP